MNNIYSYYITIILGLTIINLFINFIWSIAEIENDKKSIVKKDLSQNYYLCIMSLLLLLGYITIIINLFWGTRISYN